MIHQMADGLGVQVETHVVMSNHFHVLLRVPKREPVSDAELLRRWRVLHPNLSKLGQARVEMLEKQLPLNTPLAAAWRSRLLAQMGDLSQYMKMLKQRFTIWFNRTHRRFGTLWCERFGSTLVELEDRPMRAVAAYIDLNCVRAGLVQDPKDYRFGGYGQAVAGHAAARRGIERLMGRPWGEAQREYRMMVFSVGAEPSEKGACIAESDVARVIQQDGKLAATTILRCRIRYFSRGAVLGSGAFVEAQRLRLVDKLGSRARARPIPPLATWGDLAVLRQPRLPGVAPPVVC